MTEFHFILLSAGSEKKRTALPFRNAAVFSKKSKGENVLIHHVCTVGACILLDIEDYYELCRGGKWTSVEARKTMMNKFSSGLIEMAKSRWIN